MEYKAKYEVGDVVVVSSAEDAFGGHGFIEGQHVRIVAVRPDVEVEGKWYNRYEAEPVVPGEGEWNLWGGRWFIDGPDIKGLAIEVTH